MKPKQLLWLLIPAMVVGCFLSGMLTNAWLSSYEQESLKKMVQAFDERYQIMEGRIDCGDITKEYRYISFDGGSNWLEQVKGSRNSREYSSRLRGETDWGWTQDRLTLWQLHFANDIDLTMPIRDESLFEQARARETAIRLTMEHVKDKYKAGRIVDHAALYAYKSSQYPKPVSIVELWLPNKVRSNPAPQTAEQITVPPKPTGLAAMDNVRLLTAFLEASRGTETGKLNPSH